MSAFFFIFIPARSILWLDIQLNSLFFRVLSLTCSSGQVQASIGANTYVISGVAENKKLQELLPGSDVAL